MGKQRVHVLVCSSVVGCGSQGGKYIHYTSREGRNRSKEGGLAGAVPGGLVPDEQRSAELTSGVHIITRVGRGSRLQCRSCARVCIQASTYAHMDGWCDGFPNVRVATTGA